MTGPGGNAEELRERGESDAAQAALEQPAGERGCAQRRLGQSSTVVKDQLPFEEALVEAGVVRDEERVACERQEAADDAGDGRCAPELLLPQSRQTRHRLREAHARVHE